MERPPECCITQVPTLDLNRQEGALWSCPTCGRRWVYVIEESEGSSWHLAEGSEPFASEPEQVDPRLPTVEETERVKAEAEESRRYLIQVTGHDPAPVVDLHAKVETLEALLVTGGAVRRVYDHKVQEARRRHFGGQAQDEREKRVPKLAIARAIPESLGRIVQ